jgi:hypothetical protein
VVLVDKAGNTSSIQVDQMSLIPRTTLPSVTPQASHRDNTLYSSKDQEIVTFLLTMKLSISKTEREGRYGKMRFYFDKKEATKYVRLWTSGQPIAISDIRDVFQAQRIFYAAIHDEI